MELWLRFVVVSAFMGELLWVRVWLSTKGRRRQKIDEIDKTTMRVNASAHQATDRPSTI